MITNSKHACAICDIQFIDTDMSYKQMSDRWVCGRCSDGRIKNKMENQKLEVIPEFFNDATTLELNLCSIYMVNSYQFSLQRNGPKNRFQYQSVVFENDLNTLTNLVLPRLPDSCKYLMIKRGNVDTKCDHLKVNVDRIKQILKFYIQTNPEQKKLYESGELQFSLDPFKDDNEGKFMDHVDGDGY